ncbi:hypothetical protein BT67DRAFT_51001 [Trichocladium antarcticum]|uniref:Uncharacterized protein n=1 Tax=Trichocladium antarcticum TaxID=1450529 RepID=A0AAN6ZD32_9PEZI|nr:hypothetical protein BT67DRAFT_51001 [Trichocladium antarcticum]
MMRWHDAHGLYMPDPSLSRFCLKVRPASVIAFGQTQVLQPPRRGWMAADLPNQHRNQPQNNPPPPGTLELYYTSGSVCTVATRIAITSMDSAPEQNGGEIHAPSPATTTPITPPEQGGRQGTCIDAHTSSHLGSELPATARSVQRNSRPREVAITGRSNGQALQSGRDASYGPTDGLKGPLEAARWADWGCTATPCGPIIGGACIVQCAPYVTPPCACARRSEPASRKMWDRTSSVQGGGYIRTGARRVL